MPNEPIRRTSRRTILRGAIVGGGVSALLRPFRWVAQAATAPELAVEGESFAGFIIVPPGEGVPLSLPQSNRTPPPLEHLGGDRKPLPQTSYQHDAAVAVARDAGLQLYWPSQPDKELVDIGGVVTRQLDGRVYEACVGLGRPVAGTDFNEPILTIAVSPRVSKPCLFVAPGTPKDPGEYERATYLPAPGLVVSTPRGYAAFWFEGSNRYSLVSH